MDGASAEARWPFPGADKSRATATLRSSPPERRPWSARRTLCFILVTCGGFWATVLALLLR